MSAAAGRTCPELAEGDLDFAQRVIIVRDGKGEKNTLLEAHYDIRTVLLQVSRPKVGAEDRAGGGPKRFGVASPGQLII